jgi:hypothetical protein
MPVNDNAPDRDLCFSIRAGAERGFGVYEGERLICGFTNATDMAHWIEERLAPLDPPAPVSEPIPHGIQPDHQPKRIGGWRK